MKPNIKWKQHSVDNGLLKWGGDRGEKEREREGERKTERANGVEVWEREQKGSLWDRKEVRTVWMAGAHVLFCGMHVSHVFALLHPSQLAVMLLSWVIYNWNELMDKHRYARWALFLACFVVFVSWFWFKFYHYNYRSSIDKVRFVFELFWVLLPLRFAFCFRYKDVFVCVFWMFSRKCVCVCVFMAEIMHIFA